MTKLVKCRHCGHAFGRVKGRPGRPALFCKRSCRQRAFEHRRSRSKTGLRHQPTRAHHTAVTNDAVMTPPRLARALVAALRPSGTILEPCAGTGNLVRALRPYGRVSWCEIKRGRDFFAWREPVTWVIGNPPWSEYRGFLAHALTVADHVAFISTLNHLWTKARRRLVTDAGFGISRIIEFDAPREWHPSTGFQMGMVVLTRGHTGPCALEPLTSPENPRRSATL